MRLIFSCYNNLMNYDDILFRFNVVVRDYKKKKK